MPAFDPLRPFDALPPLPPKADLETRAVLKRCIEARSALAELKQAGALIPNQDVLINTIPIREARDSSAIENIVTTDDKLFHYAAARTAETDPGTKEALRYRTALFEGYREIRQRPLTTGTAVRICRIIQGAEVDIRNTPGTALRGAASGDIVYTPPEGDRLLREKLGNWERYLHEDTETDPLIRMAVGHYQFEAIHPFTDGNGRTGRVLNILYLIGEGMLEIPVLYLSRYIIENRGDYYRLLLRVTTAAEWEPWIVYMLTAVERTAKWTTAKIRAIRSLMDDTSDYVREARPKIYSRDLIELIFVQPYCRIDHLTEAGIARRATASKYLKALCGAGVLREIKAGRDKLFIHPTYLELLKGEANAYRPYGRPESAAPVVPAQP